MFRDFFNFNSKDSQVQKEFWKGWDNGYFKLIRCLCFGQSDGIFVHIF